MRLQEGLKVAAWLRTLKNIVSSDHYLNKTLARCYKWFFFTMCNTSSTINNLKKNSTKQHFLQSILK